MDPSYRLPEPHGLEFIDPSPLPLLKLYPYVLEDSSEAVILLRPLFGLKSKPAYKPYPIRV